MALLQNEKTILLDNVRSGQVLKIIYDGDEDLILVVDPEAKTVINTSQGRPGKLHAIKLKSLSEYDMFQLIKTVRSLKKVNPRLIYDEFKLTPYSDARRNYRTYTREKIKKISRVTIGQVSKGTHKLAIGNSILYGVNHGSYVEVSINHYPTIIKEIKDKGYKIFYEGIGDKPEPIILELFDILEVFDDTFDTTQLKFESWDIDVQSGKTEYSTILPLFGSNLSEFKKNISKSIGNTPITGKTLLEVLLMSAKPGGWITSASPDIIRNVVAMAPDNIAAKLNSYLDGEYTDSNFKRFHTLGQQYAFADWEKPTEIPRGTAIDNLQKRVNLDRDVQLKRNMETTPGIYFTGAGHIGLVEKLLKT